MTIEVRPARPEEYEETGRVTALAYREFADGDSWDRYLDLIADVGARADIALVLAAFEDGRVLGSATLELDQRIENDDPALPPEQAEIRMLGVDPDRRGVVWRRRSWTPASRGRRRPARHGCSCTPRNG